jgi:16S rRNA (uracil1498-N3)-methyltransferase
VTERAVTDSQLRRAAAVHILVRDLESPRIDDDDRHHLQSVLRLRRGEAVSVTDGRGGWRLCQFDDSVELVPVGDVVRQVRPDPPICIGFAPVKGDRPEWAVQKLTEIGVDRIIVLRTERGVVRWDGERIDRHLQRLRVVARQALMQSRRIWLPEISGPEDASELVARAGVAIAAPGGRPPDLSLATVLVGPEGGWSEAEEGRARARVGLGDGVLRTESAALSAGILLAALRGGLVRPGGSP